MEKPFYLHLRDYLGYGNQARKLKNFLEVFLRVVSIFPRVDGRWSGRERKVISCALSVLTQLTNPEKNEGNESSRAPLSI